MSLPLVTPTQNQSSAFSFELLKVLVALSKTEPIFYFEVCKGVGYTEKLCPYLPGNSGSIEAIQSLFLAPENPKVVPLKLIVVVFPWEKKGIGQIVCMLPN